MLSTNTTATAAAAVGSAQEASSSFRGVRDILASCERAGAKAAKVSRYLTKDGGVSDVARATLSEMSESIQQLASRPGLTR